MKRKPLALAACFSTLIVVAGFLSLNGMAAMFFNSLFGANVYAIEIDYSPQLASKSVATPVTLALNLSVISIRVPNETILAEVNQLSREASFNNSFTISLTVSGISNNLHVYDRTFTFQDANPRSITCYLPGYDSCRYPLLTVAVDGQYVLDGREFKFNPQYGTWSL